MSTITREELKEELDGGVDFKLVNCLDDWMFRAKRIPGSIHFETLKHALETLDPKEEVIVYCSCPNEESSARVALLLHRKGIVRVRLLLGGIDAWRALNLSWEPTSRPPKP